MISQSIHPERGPGSNGFSGSAAQGRCMAPAEFMQVGASRGATVASIVLPGSEDPAALLKRGGLTLDWKLGDRTVTVSRFQEQPLRRVVDQSLALPTLYLHFLDSTFLPAQYELSNTLRAGNDNDELIVVLPAAFTTDEDRTLRNRSVSTELRTKLQAVLQFLRSQGEAITSTPTPQQTGSFGVNSAKYKAAGAPSRLFYSLKTARPKAEISLNKPAFGIPDQAELYLFAENHVSVAYMDDETKCDFEACIEELPTMTGDFKSLGDFLKVFYEGGFAYNRKIESGSGSYLPKTCAVACMSVVPAYAGQAGIATGYPYLLDARFLSFAATVPVTIRSITEMSPRHARYGLCFTRCVFVWGEGTAARPALGANDTLNFCSVLPHGGFYYVPKSLREYQEFGAFIYPFGEDRSVLEAPLDISDFEGGGSANAGSRSRPDDGERRTCVICLDGEATMATVPCGHRAYCADCGADPRERGPCPVCRQSVTNIIRIY